MTELRGQAAPARLLLPPRNEADRLVARIAQAPEPLAGQAVVLAQSGDGRTLARAIVGSGCRCERGHRGDGAAARIAQPAEPAGAGRAAKCRLGGAAGRALAAAAGGDSRRRPRLRRYAVRRLAVLPAPCAGAVHRGARGRSRHAAAARGVGADPRGPAAAGRCRTRRADQMGGARRAADPLRRTAHGRTADRRDRSADAGQAARRRPPTRRGVVLGGTGRGGAVHRQLAVRRPGRAGRGEGQPAGAGGAFGGSDRPHLGGARRRHAAGDAGDARGGSRGAVPRHRQRRLVQSAVVGAVRGHAAAAGRAVGGRRSDLRHQRAGAGRDAGRLRPAVRAAAGRDRPARGRDRPHRRLAAPSARAVRAGERSPRAEPRRQSAGARGGAAGARRPDRELRRGGPERALGPPLLAMRGGPAGARSADRARTARAAAAEPGRGGGAAARAAGRDRRRRRSRAIPIRRWPRGSATS